MKLQFLISNYISICMEIRLATSEDFTSIDEFDIFLGDRMTEIERKELWVALKDEMVIAYLSFNNQFYGRPFVHFLNVRKEFRRSGAGVALMKKFEELCKDEEKLFTSTESHNLPMLLLLDKLDYKCCGVVDKIQKESEIIFCKELNSKE